MITLSRMNMLGSAPFKSSLRTATATLCSVSAHVGMAVLVLNMGGVFGQTSAPSESISVNVVHTLVLDAITEAAAEEPPAASMAQTASMRSDGPPDETVPAPQPDAAKLKREAEEALEAAKAAQRAEAERKRAEAQALEEARQRAEAEALDAARRAEETRLAEEFRQMEKERQDAALRKEAEAHEAETAKARAELQRKEAERKQAELKRDKELAEARRTEELRKEDAKRKKAAAAKESRAASMASSGKESPKAGKGQTSASRGDVFAYAALVRARVAANRPSGSGQNGTVIVSFGVSASGGITHVSIARSSGSAALDNAARSAVRNAGPFPPPPDSAGRSFSVPFHFQ